MENPYQAPNSRIDVPESTETELASRGNRFGASFIDGLIQFAVFFPLEYATGFWQQVMDATKTHVPLPAATTIMWKLFGIAIFLMVQGYPLFKDCQTWGKKVCSIKIAAMDGGRPTTQQLAIRYGFYLLVGAIPYIGPFVSLISILLIFREDRRCGHDLVAGTRVVTA